MNILFIIISAIAFLVGFWLIVDWNYEYFKKEIEDKKDE